MITGGAVAPPGVASPPPAQAASRSSAPNQTQLRTRLNEARILKAAGKRDTGVSEDIGKKAAGGGQWSAQSLTFVDALGEL